MPRICMANACLLCFLGQRHPMRLIKCKRCGRIIETDKQKSYCDDCRTAIKRESVLRDRICDSCGVAFVGYPRSKYCPSCRYERKKADSRAHKQRERRGQTRKIGSESICEICGKPYTVESGRQRYCPDCAPAAISENVRAQKRAYMADHIVQNQESKARLKTDRKVCVVCGRTFTSDRVETVCSDECAEKRKKKWQKRGDTKRAPRKSKKGQKSSQ